MTFEVDTYVAEVAFEVSLNVLPRQFLGLVAFWLGFVFLVAGSDPWGFFTL